jgi:hypothetical protein
MVFGSKIGESRLTSSVAAPSRRGFLAGWVAALAVAATPRQCSPGPPVQVGSALASAEVSGARAGVVEAASAAASVAVEVAFATGLVVSAMATAHPAVPPPVRDSTGAMAVTEASLAVGMTLAAAVAHMTTDQAVTEIVVETAVEMAADTETVKGVGQAATWSLSVGEKVGIEIGTMIARGMMITVNAVTREGVMKIRGRYDGTEASTKRRLAPVGCSASQPYPPLLNLHHASQKGKRKTVQCPAVNLKCSNIGPSDNARIFDKAARRNYYSKIPHTRVS